MRKIMGKENEEDGGYGGGEGYDGGSDADGQGEEQGGSH